MVLLVTAIHVDLTIYDTQWPLIFYPYFSPTALNASLMLKFYEKDAIQLKTLKIMLSFWRHFVNARVFFHKI